MSSLWNRDHSSFLSPNFPGSAHTSAIPLRHSTPTIAHMAGSMCLMEKRLSNLLPSLWVFVRKPGDLWVVGYKADFYIGEDGHDYSLSTIRNRTGCDPKLRVPDTRKGGNIGGRLALPFVVLHRRLEGEHSGRECGRMGGRAGRVSSRLARAVAPPRGVTLLRLCFGSDAKSARLLRQGWPKANE